MSLQIKRKITAVIATAVLELWFSFCWHRLVRGGDDEQAHNNAASMGVKITLFFWCLARFIVFPEYFISQWHYLHTAYSLSIDPSFLLNPKRFHTVDLFLWGELDVHFDGSCDGEMPQGKFKIKVYFVDDDSVDVFMLHQFCVIIDYLIDVSV